MAEPVRRVRGDTTTWPLSIAILVTLGITAASLGSLIDDSWWWFVAMGASIIVTGAMAATRVLLRGRAWPLLAGVVTLVATLSLFFATSTSILGLIPTPDTVKRLSDLALEGERSIAVQEIPAIVTPGILLLLTGGIALVAIVLDLFAVTLRRPALSGLVLLGIVLIPTFIDPDLSDTFWFVLVGAAWLFLIHAGSPYFEPRAAVAIGAASIVTAIVVQLVVLPSPPVIDRTNEGDLGYTTGLNPLLTLGKNLRRDDPVVAMRYITSSETNEYFTFSVLDVFDDEGWNPGALSADEPTDLANIAPAPGLDSEIATLSITASVSIGAIGGRWIPVPYAPTRIRGLEGNWVWQRDNLGIRSSSSSMQGQKYEADLEIAVPTAAQLRASGEDVSQAVSEYTQLPDDLPEVIRERALEVAGDEDTNYDKAIALQNYFRDGSFEYSESAPVDEGYDGDDADIIAVFLDGKSGYCVHFSSSMAVMARTLGIPARVSVGFTPGELRDGKDGPEYVITTDNLHAWPELYFDDVGWVRFEPTPGTGNVPVFAGPLDPSNDPTPDQPDDEPTEQPTGSPIAPTATPTPTPSATSSSGVAAGESTSTPLWVTLGLGILLVLFIPFVPAIIRAARRRSRFAAVARSGDAFAAWSEIVDTAVDLRVPFVLNRTPRELEDSLVASAALARLRAAVEEAAYGSTDGLASRDDLRQALAAQRAAASRWTRLRARFAPASLLTGRTPTLVE